MSRTYNPGNNSFDLKISRAQLTGKCIFLDGKV